MIADLISGLMVAHLGTLLAGQRVVDWAAVKVLPTAGRVVVMMAVGTAGERERQSVEL